MKSHLQKLTTCVTQATQLVQQRTLIPSSFTNSNRLFTTHNSISTSVYKSTTQLASNASTFLRSYSTSISTNTNNNKQNSKTLILNTYREFSKQVSREQLSKEGNPADIAITLDRVTKRLDGGRVLFEDISTAFYHGAKIGILGKNGAGKSSLLKALAGRDPNIEGMVKTTEGKRVGYLAQEPELDETKNVLENIFDGVGDRKIMLDRYDEICTLFEDPDADIDALIEEQADLQAKIDEFDGWDLNRQVEIAMEALGCPPPESRVEHLSGGEKRRVALCRLLLSQPDILLLDEPTNHLDAGSVSWLEKFLQQYTGLVVAITHDRYFLDNVAGWILEIDSGRFLPFRGNYGQWLDARARRLNAEDRESANVKRNLERELQFIQKGQKGQQSKGKARVRKVEDLQAQKESLRRSRVESGTLVIPQGPRLGNRVIQVNNLALAYNDEAGRGVIHTKDEIDTIIKEKGEESVEWIFKNVDFDVSPGQIVGIVGPNGVGKTTLLKMIMGEKIATLGSIDTGSSVQYGYNAQTREKLADDKCVWEEIAEGTEWIDLDDKTRLNVRTYVAQFNFCGADQSKLIGTLSGGERNRVHLAKSLRRGANVILLDEPTNDLDVDTLRSLEDALNSFEGCAFVVSHDRWFLDRVCTDILAFYDMPDIHSDRTVVSSEYFYGNYSDFLDHFKAKHKRDFVDTRKKLKNMMNF